MKHLTKLMTSLLCLVMMFGVSSCTEDSTTDVVVVSSAKISSVLGGNGKLQIEGVVPDDDVITSCNVTITSEAGSVVESFSIDLVPGGSISETVDGLSAGTYTVSIQTVGGTLFADDLSIAKVIVYDETTYSTQPSLGMFQFSAEEYGLIWYEVPEDCQGAELSYKDVEGDETVVTLSEVAVGDTTMLTNAAAGAVVSLETYYCPVYGIDNVTLVFDEEIVIPDGSEYTLPLVVYSYNEETNVVTATFGYVQEACQGVKFSYTNVYGESKTTALTAVEEGSEVEFEVGVTVAYGSSITYSAFFGDELMEKTSEEAYDCVSLAPNAPTSVTVVASVDEEYNPILVVTWDVATEGDVAGESATIYYTNVADEVEYTQSVALALSASNTHTATISADLVAGASYLVEVTSTGGELSGNAESERTAAEAEVVAYGAASFSSAIMSGIVYGSAEYEFETEVTDEDGNVTTETETVIVDIADATLLWESSDVEIVGLTVVYTDSLGTEVTVVAEDFTETFLAGIAPGSTFSYTVELLPEGGLLPVSLANADETNVFSAIAIEAPSSAVLYSGNGRFQLAWAPGETANAAIVTYTDALGASASATVSDLTADEEGNVTVEFADLAAGTYDVAISNIVGNSQSAAYAVGSVDVYTAETYAAVGLTASLVDGYIYFGLDGAAASALSEDIQSFTITYGGVATEYTVDALTYGLSIAGTSADYSYSVTFLPESGLDEVVTDATAGTAAAGTADITLTTDEDGVTTAKIYTAKGMLAYGDYINGYTTSLTLGAIITGDYPLVTVTTDEETGETTTTVNKLNTMSATLEADVDLSDICATLGTWIPIGDYSANTTAYGATFDGQGHTISGLYINTYNKTYQGLFGRSGSASTFKNFTLESPVVNISSSSAANAYYCGGVIGYVYTCTVSAQTTYCRYTAATTFTDIIVNNPAITSSSETVGALAGYGAGILNNCHSVGGFVHCTGEYPLTANAAGMGGLLGRLQIGVAYNCTNSTAVSTLSQTSSTNVGVGGIAGFSAAAWFYNCINYGDIDAYVCVGGIVGKSNSGPAIGCINYGNITAGDKYIGGIFGYATGATSYLQGRFYGCANYGDIFATSKGAAYVGGLVGYSTTVGYKMAGSFNAGTVTTNEVTEFVTSAAGAMQGYVVDGTETFKPFWNNYYTNEVVNTNYSAGSTYEYDGQVGCRIYSSGKGDAYLNGTDDELDEDGNVVTAGTKGTFDGRENNMHYVSSVNTAAVVAAMNEALYNVYYATDYTITAFSNIGQVEGAADYYPQWTVGSSTPKVTLVANPNSAYVAAGYEQRGSYIDVDAIYGSN